MMFTTMIVLLLLLLLWNVDRVKRVMYDIDVHPSNDAENDVSQWWRALGTNTPPRLVKEPVILLTKIH